MTRGDTSNDYSGGFALANPTPPPDTLVIFRDRTDVEYVCAVHRLGHTDSEVRAVAYRWACGKIANGDWHPHGELRFGRLSKHS
jgi:hypothetical protein